jgi:hypothetical protein
MIPRAVGAERRALENLRGMMMTTERRPLVDAQGHPQYDRLGNERFHEVPVSQNDAEVLHKVKQEIDNVIQYDPAWAWCPSGCFDAPTGCVQHVASRGLNSALEDQVPGYLEANRQSAALGSTRRRCRSWNAVSRLRQDHAIVLIGLRPNLTRFRRVKRSPSPRAAGAISSAFLGPRPTTFRRSAASCKARAAGIPPRSRRSTGRKRRRRTGGFGRSQSEIPRHLQQGGGEQPDGAAAGCRPQHEAGTVQRNASG